MCFQPDSQPPIAPIAGGAIDGRRIELTSADDTRFVGYLARADRPSGAAMLVLPDVRGLYAFYEELALRFAEAGIDALAIDYFGRTVGTGPRSPDFPFRDHVAQTAYPNLLLDLQAAVDRLREETSAQALLSIGFCYGGRLSYLCATRPELGMAGVIAFYGWPVDEFRAGMPAPADLAAEMRTPVLSIFGETDDGIPAEARDELARALAAAGVKHEAITYPGAPHSFFDRKAADFADASADAWRRVLDFVHARR
jgi:carboxymethylenebutenolidase